MALGNAHLRDSRPESLALTVSASYVAQKDTGGFEGAETTTPQNCVVARPRVEATPLTPASIFTM